MQQGSDPVEQERARLAMLARYYPHPNDPGRSPIFGQKRTDEQIRDLLGAILTQLYNMSEDDGGLK